MNKLKCKCIAVDDFFQNCLILGDIYYYEIFEYTDKSGLEVGVDRGYNVWTLDGSYVCGGIERVFTDRFMDLSDYRECKLLEIIS